MTTSRQRVKVRVHQRARARVRWGNAIAFNVSFVKVKKRNRRHRKSI